MRTPILLAFIGLGPALAACGSQSATAPAPTPASADRPCATCTASPPVAIHAPTHIHTPTQAPQTTPTPKPTTSYDPGQIIEYLHLAADVPGFTGYVYTAPGSGLRCEVALTILTSADMVDSVDGGSFVVATNPDRTAGVVIWSTEKVTCKQLLTEALKGFPPK